MFKFLLKRNHHVEFFSRAAILGAIQITPYPRFALSSTTPFLAFH